MAQTHNTCTVDFLDDRTKGFTLDVLHHLVWHYSILAKERSVQSNIIVCYYNEKMSVVLIGQIYNLAHLPIGRNKRLCII